MLPNSQRRTSNPSTDQTENVVQNTEKYEPRYISFLILFKSSRRSNHS